jgi:acetate---CoA ligase (ADP-forming)
MFAATGKMQEWADRQRTGPETPAVPSSASRVGDWHSRLADASQIDEQSALDLLSHFGVPAIGRATHEEWQGVRVAAEALGYPVALKTAAEGIDHKSDRGGVILNIADEAALVEAYQKLASTLGKHVIVQQMAAPGTELAFGYVKYPDFGPLIMVSAGGTLVELFADRRFALAPFSEAKALALIDSLPIARLLDGVRGKARADKAGAARALAAFSKMCAALAGAISEVDVNPVIVSARGAFAVDALVIPVFSSEQRL